MTSLGARSLRLCIIGGSPNSPGGVEIFCERALAAVKAHWDGCDALWLPADSTYLTVSRLPHFLRALRALRMVHRTPVDIVWLNVSNLPDLLYLYLAKWLGIPVIATLHLGANSRLQRNPALRCACRLLLRRADRIALLFDGQDAEIDLPRSVPRVMIRTFLPAESFAPPERVRRREVLRLIHAGRLSESKGSVAMVEVCAALARARVPFEARIVGRGDERVMTKIHACITAHGLHDRVTLSDWLNGPALLKALRAADLLVHLSRLDSFPLTVLEAMGSSTVPVAIDMAGVRTMMAPYGGKLVDPQNAVAEASEWVAGQGLSDLRRHGNDMGARVRRDYSWAACVALLRAAVVGVLASAIGQG